MSTWTPLELLGMDAHGIDAALDEFDAAALEVLVRRANREYWEEDAASLPDALYDRLVEALRRIDPEAAVLQEFGAPTPGGPAADNAALRETPPERRFGQAVAHTRAMRSLDKCYDDETLEKWAHDFEGPVLAMPKMDGVALSIRYGADGTLMVGATRGDGRVGDDITKNVLLIPDIPRTIPPSPDGVEVEVRGEVYMRRSVFERFAADYSNPRNLAAGTLKQKDGDPERCGHLNFFAYDLLGVPLSDEREKFEHLQRLGFSHEGHDIDVIEKDAVAANFVGFSGKRPELDYEIDGVVYRASLRREQERLGETAHHPRWAIAYKFQGDSGLTALEDVAWSVSRTGTITPVALLAPIELSGAVIRRASLHNLSRFHELSLRVGCSVEVTRRGGVIPMVERVAEADTDAAPFEVPTTCPACGAPVAVRAEREAQFLQCAAPEGCQQATISSIEHFAKVADIQGFGPRVIEQCFDRALLKDPADFYTLTASELAQLERVGAKSAQNLIDAIDARRQLDLPTFLQSLGIAHLGRQYAELLSNSFGNLDGVLAASPEQLTALHGVSDLVAAALREGFASRASLIQRLRQHVELRAYEAPAAPATADTGHPLHGKSVLFTGTLAHCDRKTAQAMVTAAGGTAARAVNKSLDILVVGAGRGAKSSKQKKAESLVAQGEPLTIMGEEDFLALVDRAL